VSSPLFNAAGVPLPVRAKPSGRPSSRRVKVSPQLEIGKAAEHLVCADLLLNGWTAYLSGQGLPYDIVVDTADRMVRIQVKSTLCPKNPSPSARVTPAYFFHVRRAGRGGKRLYAASEFDVYALVALDRRAVAYFAVAEMSIQCVSLRIPGTRYGPGGRMSRDFDGASFERALSVVCALASKTGMAATRMDGGRSIDEEVRAEASAARADHSSSL